MGEFIKQLESFGDLTSSFTLLDVAVVFFLSLVLSLIVGWVYRTTHRGVSYSQSYVHTLVIFFYFARIVALPAVALLGLWFVIQFLQGAFAGGSATGVAFWAHIGGFAAGVVLIKLFERRKLVAAKRDHRVLTRDELSRWERW